MVTIGTFNVIGVSCSPRKNGNMDILVQQVLESAAEDGGAVEFLRISDMKISPCDACWSCAEAGECHIADDMQDVYSNMENLVLRARSETEGSASESCD